MLYDDWMYRGNDNFIRNKLLGERGVLDFFSKYQTSDGSLKNTPYRAFVDWAGNLAGGVNDADGSAAIYDLYHLDYSNILNGIRQINRPTFKMSGLSELCSFLEYKDIHVWFNRISKL